MNLPLPPATGPSTPTSVSPVVAVPAVTAVAGAAPVAPAQPVAPTAPVQPALSLSAQAQQALRLQVFQTLIAQLVTQVQSGSQTSWPSAGASPALRELLTALVAQATAGLPQPQQLVAAQPWPQAWLNTVLAPAAPASASTPAPAPASAGSAATPGNAAATGNAAVAGAAADMVAGKAAVALATTVAATTVAPALLTASAPAAAAVPSTAATAAAPPTATIAAAPAAPLSTAVATAAPTLVGTATPDAAPRLPPMLTWLVQQGVVQTPEGERGFALTLQVPQAWAQMQAAASAALPAAAASPPAMAPLPTAGPVPLKLPFAAPAQQLESGALALVLQGAAPGGDKLRTSALLWLDFQPLQATAQNTQSAATALAGLLPSTQAAQQAMVALQAKNDPWLQMAALQASGQQPRDDQRLQERRTGLCTELGCPYRGKASCAQPFCAEMNRVWASVRIGPTGT